MRTLYFDIDGTLLLGSFGDPKPALAGGAFERAVRQAGVERLVCVGNVVHIVHALERLRPTDGLGTVLRVCQGVFEDEAWFRAATTLCRDPARRAAEIDTGADWLWVDDLAATHCAEAGLADLYRVHVGGRILAPRPDDDGADVLAWLARLAAVPA